MKKLLIMASAAGLLFGSMSCNGGSSANAKDLKTPEDSLSYYFGEMWGKGVASEIKTSPDSAKFSKAEFIKGLELALKADTSKVGFTQGLAAGAQLAQMFEQFKKTEGINIDTKLVLASFKQAFEAKNPGNPQETQMVVMNLMQKISNEKKSKSPEAIANKKSGEAFINSEMKKDPSIKKTASGLAYKVVAPGNGQKFKATDQIEVIYTGKKIDGKQFDASGDKARVFSPAAVVPGFKEGLEMMSPGAKYVFYIPGELAYGLQGQQGVFGPNETLVFEVSTPALAPANPAAAQHEAPVQVQPKTK